MQRNLPKSAALRRDCPSAFSTFKVLFLEEFSRNCGWNGELQANKAVAYKRTFRQTLSPSVVGGRSLRNGMESLLTHAERAEKQEKTNIIRDFVSLMLANIITILRCLLCGEAGNLKWDQAKYITPKCTKQQQGLPNPLDHRKVTTRGNSLKRCSALSSQMMRSTRSQANI